MSTCTRATAHQRIQIVASGLDVEGVVTTMMIGHACDGVVEQVGATKRGRVRTVCAADSRVVGGERAGACAPLKVDRVGAGSCHTTC